MKTEGLFSCVPASPVTILDSVGQISIISGLIDLDCLVIGDSTDLHLSCASQDCEINLGRDIEQNQSYNINNSEWQNIQLNQAVYVGDLGEARVKAIVTDGLSVARNFTNFTMSAFGLISFVGGNSSWEIAPVTLVCDPGFIQFDVSVDFSFLSLTSAGLKMFCLESLHMIM